jgi:hypothetical protein
MATDQETENPSIGAAAEDDAGDRIGFGWLLLYSLTLVIVGAALGIAATSETAGAGEVFATIAAIGGVLTIGLWYRQVHA